MKSIQDTSSIRSPSSLAITDKTTTRNGSQASLRSAMSLKESPGTPTGKESINFEKNHNKFAEKVESNPKGKYDDSRNLLSSYDKSRDALTSSPVDTKSVASSVTPVPTARKNIKSSKTHLVEGVPQTEV